MARKKIPTHGRCEHIVKVLTGTSARRCRRPATDIAPDGESLVCAWHRRATSDSAAAHGRPKPERETGDLQAIAMLLWDRLSLDDRAEIMRLARSAGLHRAEK